MEIVSIKWQRKKSSSQCIGASRWKRGGKYSRYNGRIPPVSPTMRILSYNIQAAINARSYLSYTYQWHRQFLPGPAKRKTLARIAAYIRDFDLVCLQEIDLGGLRNGFKNHVEQLRELTGFHYHLAQVNRRLGKLSLHGNLILSKRPLREVLNVPLPSRIPGRGVLAAATAASVMTPQPSPAGNRTKRWIMPCSKAPLLATAGSAIMQTATICHFWWKSHESLSPNDQKSSRENAHPCLPFRLCVLAQPCHPPVAARRRTTDPCRNSR